MILIFDDYVNLCTFLKTKKSRDELGYIKRIQKLGKSWHVNIQDAFK